MTVSGSISTCPKRVLSIASATAAAPLPGLTCRRWSPKPTYEPGQVAAPAGTGGSSVAQEVHQRRLDDVGARLQRGGEGRLLVGEGGHGRGHVDVLVVGERCGVG